MIPKFEETPSSPSQENNPSEMCVCGHIKEEHKWFIQIGNHQ